MGHCNQNKKGSLVRQVEMTLNDRLAIGRKKNAHKAADITYKYIYSWETYRSYLKHCCYFVKWCSKTHGCKTLEECHPYMQEWMKTRKSLSPYTQKLEVSALAKLYGYRTGELDINTASRCRKDIKRSRNEVSRDRHFSEQKHADFVAFCRSTGLRRGELKALRGTALYQDPSGTYYIHVTSGSKGGRERYAPVIGDIELVCKLCRDAGKNKVFPSIPSAADVHSYRAEYATQIYKQYVRPLEHLERHEIYYCRGDRKGEKFDRTAMKKASQALGHNRISVVAGHYLRI